MAVLLPAASNRGTFRTRNAAGMVHASLPLAGCPVVARKCRDPSPNRPRSPAYPILRAIYPSKATAANVLWRAFAFLRISERSPHSFEIAGAQAANFLTDATSLGIMLLTYGFISGRMRWNHRRPLTGAGFPLRRNRDRVE